MIEEKKINILIIGAGKGGTLLLEMLSREELVTVIGVVDVNLKASGIILARS